MDEGLFAILLVVGTSIWVLVDATKLMDQLSAAERKALVPHGGQSPGTWLLACLLLWIIAFPYYLIVRGKYVAAVQAKNRHP